MNLAIVETPLELLNAIEARHHWDEPTHLLILLGDFGVDSFEPLLRRDEWQSVRYFRIFRKAELQKESTELWRTLRQLWRRTRFDRLLRSYGAVDKILLGNYLDVYKHYMRHAHHVVHHRNLILLDDGTDTIVVARQLAERGQVRVPAERATRRGPIGRLRAALRRHLVDWTATESDRVTFFTVFDITVRPSDTVIRHDYGALRRALGRNVPTSTALFLGQCLVEDGYLDLSSYLDQLGHAFDLLKPLEIIYVPHPRETTATAEAVSDRFKVLIERPALPIECHIAASGTCPKVLASFFCSALINCSIIFAGLIEVVSFRLDDRVVLRFLDTMQPIYQYLAEMPDRVKLIPIDPGDRAAADRNGSIHRTAGLQTQAGIEPGR